MDDLRSYLNARDAAAVLNVHPDTVVDMVNDCTIPSRFVYRIGKRGEIRIHPMALDPSLTPAAAGPHPQTHSLLAVIDRLRTNIAHDLAELDRIREVVQEGLPWTPRLLPTSSSGFSAD